MADTAMTDAKENIFRISTVGNEDGLHQLGIEVIDKQRAKFPDGWTMLRGADKETGSDQLIINDEKKEVARICRYGLIIHPTPVTDKVGKRIHCLRTKGNEDVFKTLGFEVVNDQFIWLPTGWTTEVELCQNGDTHIYNATKKKVAWYNHTPNGDYKLFLVDDKKRKRTAAANTPDKCQKIEGKCECDALSDYRCRYCDMQYKKREKQRGPSSFVDLKFPTTPKPLTTAPDLRGLYEFDNGNLRFAEWNDWKNGQQVPFPKLLKVKDTKSNGRQNCDFVSRIQDRYDKGIAAKAVQVENKAPKKGTRLLLGFGPYPERDSTATMETMETMETDDNKDPTSSFHSSWVATILNRLTHDKVSNPHMQLMNTLQRKEFGVAANVEREFECALMKTIGHWDEKKQKELYDTTVKMNDPLIVYCPTIGNKDVFDSCGIEVVDDMRIRLPANWHMTQSNGCYNLACDNHNYTSITINRQGVAKRVLINIGSVDAYVEPNEENNQILKQLGMKITGRSRVTSSSGQFTSRVGSDTISVPPGWKAHYNYRGGVALFYPVYADRHVQDDSKPQAFIVGGRISVGV